MYGLFFIVYGRHKYITFMSVTVLPLYAEAVIYIQGSHLHLFNIHEHVENPFR